MTCSIKVADLVELFDVAAVQRALETAYTRGFQDGQDAFKKAILSLEPNASGVAAAESDRDVANTEADGRRAPRGLTRTVIINLLKRRGAMTMADLQFSAVGADARLSSKTVYNELKRERGKLYREQNDLWSLIGEHPVEAANLFVKGTEDVTV